MPHLKLRPRDKIALQVFAGFVCSTPFYVWFDYFRGDRGRAMAAVAAGTAFFSAVGLFWALRKSVLFWGAVAGAGLLQVAIVLGIPWPSGAHGKGLMVLALPDMLLVNGLFRLVEKRTMRSASAETSAGRKV